MPFLYTAHAKAVGGGRDGHTETDDKKVSFDLTVPKELGGPGGVGTNPEQLFAAGYAACFLGAMRFAAGKEKIKLPAETSVSSAVSIGPREDGTGFGLKVVLEISIPGMDKAAAEDIARKGDIVCPYSHATRGNIEVTLTVV